jgi:hypothetical protein
MSEHASMPLSALMRDFVNGDGTSWAEERAWLVENHPRRLARIGREITSGFFPPVRLDFTDWSVVDGHHRIIAAERLGLAEVPVADAWDGSDWALYASDQGGDDPEEAVA